MSTYLGELQSRATQNLDAVKEQVEPYVQQAGDTATKKLSDISTVLRSQAEGLGHSKPSRSRTHTRACTHRGNHSKHTYTHKVCPMHELSKRLFQLQSTKLFSFTFFFSAVK